jgi:hypothetical protein
MLASTRLRGTLAAVILLAAVAGLPLALAATVGNPLQSWPSLTDGQLTDTGIIAVLATVFWLAWLSFTIPAALEIALTVISKLTRRPQRHLRLPLLGAQQDLARNLISAVLLLLPAASPVLSATAAPVGHQTITTITGTALASDSSRAPAAHQAQDRDRPDSATRRYVIPEVGGMRSYWALAEHYLGDGARWREIWQLNEGRVHADGSVMDSPRQLHAGWTILLPAVAGHLGDEPIATPREVTVHPGDTLSTIAASDGISDWRQLWTLNADRREPENSWLSDPDLIRPGWTITLPNGAHHRDAPSKPANGHRAHDRRDSSRPADPRPQRSSPPVTQPAHPNTDSPAPLPSATSSEPNKAPSSARMAPSHETSSHEDSDHTQHRFPIVPLEVGLAAAAAVTALDRARRIAQRRRRVGHRPLPPPAHLVEVESRVRRDARRAHPTVAAITLATALTGTHPVKIRTVVARVDGAVDLQLDDPIPPSPPPFLEVTGGWRLPADATGFGFAASDPDNLDDPCPALIPVGTTVDGQVLVNLDVTGPISVAGETGTVEALLWQLVTALAAAPWAGRVQVHVPPRFAERLGPLERLSVEDSLSPRPPAGPPGGPVSPDDGEEPGWRTTPVHLYCGWTADADLDPVLRTASAGNSHVHIIVNGAHPATSTWTLDGDQLALPTLAELVTVTLPEPAAPDPRELLDFTATAPDVPLDDSRLPDHTLAPFATGVPDNPDGSPGIGDNTQPGPAPQSTRLLLLGTIEVTGADLTRRSQVQNLLAFLALHPRGVDRHQLLAALWPDETVALQSMRNLIRGARLVLNGGITDGPIWRLTDAVTTDWQQFNVLAAGDLGQQRRALELVRGRPFAGLDDADWIDLGGFRSEVEAAIVDVALTIIEHDLASENYPGALAAARTGLLVSRYEERLHRAAIRAAEAQDLHGLSKTLQREMRTVLDIDIEPDDQIQPATLELIRDVRDRRPVSSDSTHRGSTG